MLQIFFVRNYVKARKESISNRGLVVSVSVADEAPRQLAAKGNSYPYLAKNFFASSRLRVRSARTYMEVVWLDACPRRR